MARVKVIKKKIGGDIKPNALLGDDTNDIGTLFNQLLGLDDADPEIIKPKYIKLRHNVSSIAILLHSLASDNIADRLEDKKEWFSDIKKYADILKSEAKTDTIADEDIPSNKTELNKLYKHLKDSTHIKALFIVAGQLKPYDTYLTDPEHIGGEWINDIPGLDFMPFSNFSNIDLRYILNTDSLGNGPRTMIFKIVRKIYEFINAVIKIVMSPDVDKGAFSAILLEQVTSMKKHIPRCNEAFDRIADSAKLLENNFDDYYKGFVQTRESSSMIQSFIIDVAGKQKPNAVLTRQFQTIISFYRKNTAGKPMHPKFQKVMDKLDEAYRMAESKEAETRNAEEQQKKETEASPSDEKPKSKERPKKEPKIKTRKTGKLAKRERSGIPHTVEEVDENEEYESEEYSSSGSEVELDD